MSLFSLAHWLEQREWARAFSGSAYAYPLVLATHLSCIALFGGMILITNLRLLGWAFTGFSVSEVLDRLRTWKRVGFIIMVGCGLLLAGSEATKYYANPYFGAKIALLALLGLHAVVFRHSVYRNPAKLGGAAAAPFQAKLAGSLSLILWTGVVCAGRLIGYHV